MTLCYFCQENEKPFFQYFCADCSTLRRMLLINKPDKCIEILKRVLLRNDTQISNKIKIEVKKIEIENKKKEEPDDKKDYDTPKTRSKSKL